MRVETPNLYGSPLLFKNNFQQSVESEEEIFTQSEHGAQTVEFEDIELTEEQTSNEKVGWKEAFSLIGKGFTNKVKSMFTSIVQHPLTAIGTTFLTGAALAAAPLIGISSTVAASALAIGFAGYAIFNTGKNVIETIKDNNEGRYDEVREDLTQIGGNVVDLALSLPFLPKALKNIKDTFKYGPAIGINKGLISDLKNNKGIYESFKKADIEIKYDTIGNQMGLKVKPELKFVKLNSNLSGEFEPTTATIKINESYLNPIGNLKNIMRRVDISTALSHELTHYKQFLEILNAQGTEGLKSVISEYYSTILRKNGARTTSPQSAWSEYTKRVKESIKEAEEQSKKITTLEKLQDLTRQEESTAKLFQQQAKNTNVMVDSYYNALKSASKQGIDDSIIDNLLNGDGSKFNTEFYLKALDSMADVAADSTKASEYMVAFRQKVAPDISEVKRIIEKYGVKQSDQLLKTTKFKKAQLELYKSNLLEAEAYANQNSYSQLWSSPHAAQFTIHAFKAINDSTKDAMEQGAQQSMLMNSIFLQLLAN